MAACSSWCRRTTPAASVRHVGTWRRRTAQPRHSSAASNVGSVRTLTWSGPSMFWRGGTAWQPVEILRPPEGRRPRNPPKRICMRLFMQRRRNLLPSGRGGCQHTHVRAGSDLHLGQYGGEVGPVYIEPAHDPGAYDREVFLTLKEFEPFFSQGGDMAMDFQSPASTDPQLKSRGEAAMRTALARGMK